MMNDVAAFHVTTEGSKASNEAAPLFPDIGVVAFVPEEWGGPWMSRHQVLLRLAKYFHVVWVGPAREWRELWFRNAAHIDRSDREESFPLGFTLYQSGKWLPLLYRPAPLASWIAAERVRRAKRLLRKRGCKTVVFYLWRPAFDYVLDSDSHDLSCYHIVDEYSFSPSEKELDNREVQLIKRVDQVFIHSPALFDRKGQFNPHTLFVPNGVNYQTFATPQPEPVDLKDIAHPRLGYIGHVKTQLDFRTLFELAKGHPGWSFVFVGPRGYLGRDASLLERLEGLPNVHFLGNKPVELVCAYPQHMDVCLLPYVLNDYTKHIYPLKLHEYLASGRPVVGAPISSLQKFSGLVALAKSTADWSSAIQVALGKEENASEKVHARREVARQHDWDILVRQLASTICERLGPTFKARFEHARSA